MASGKEQAKARRERAQAPALGARVSLDAPISRGAKGYGTGRQALLHRHRRRDEPRQVLLCLAHMWWRGGYSLTHLAEEPGAISLGGVT